MSSPDIPDKYPLVGKKANRPGARTPVGTFWILPPDAEWLPKGWESWAYPKSCEGSNNAEAVLQWLDYMMELYLEGAERARKMQADCPDDSMVKAFGKTDKGATVRDAYRLVRLLGRAWQWTGAPPEPDKMFSALPEDREAAAEELGKVRDWIKARKEGGAPSESTEDSGLASGPWSRPDSPSRWAKVFNCSPDTFKRMVDSGRIQYKELTKKLGQVHVDDLPAD